MLRPSFSVFVTSPDFCVLRPGSPLYRGIPHCDYAFIKFNMVHELNEVRVLNVVGIGVINTVSIGPEHVVICVVSIQ